MCVVYDDEYHLEAELDIRKSPIHPKSVRKYAAEKFNFAASLEKSEEHILQTKLEAAKSDVQMKIPTPAISRLNKRPGSANIRIQAEIKTFLEKFLSERHMELPDVSEADLLTCAALFAAPRGRCKYQTGEKGIGPASARKYIRLLYKVLQEKMGPEAEKLWPDYRYIASYWVTDLSKEFLYQRRHADYWSMGQLKTFLKACQEVLVEQVGLPNEYYAKMAMAILSITITQAGCRTGELLETKLQQVVIGEVEGSIAVAIYSGGSKMDPDNQKSAPICFMELEDKVRMEKTKT